MAACESTFKSYTDDLMSVAGLDQERVDRQRVSGSCLNPVLMSRKQQKLALHQQLYARHPKRGRSDKSIEALATASQFGNQTGPTGADQPFAAMVKWREQRLEDSRLEKQARCGRNWGKAKEMERKAERERKDMKYDRLSFIESDLSGASLSASVAARKRKEARRQASRIAVEDAMRLPKRLEAKQKATSGRAWAMVAVEAVRKWMCCSSARKRVQTVTIDERSPACPAQN